MCESEDTLFLSITTPEVAHDAANYLTELIWLNRDIHAPEYVWKDKEAGRQWGKMVACIKRLMRDFKISADQMAFYIYHCSPQRIDSNEFAKMAVVAKKLLRKYDLGDLGRMYTERRETAKVTGLDVAAHKSKKSKSLVDFLKELENGETKED